MNSIVRSTRVEASIVEHQEDLVASIHEPRRSDRINARGGLAHTCHVLAKCLPSQIWV